MEAATVRERSHQTEATPPFPSGHAGGRAV